MSALGQMFLGVMSGHLFDDDEKLLYSILSEIVSIEKPGKILEVYQIFSLKDERNQFF